MIRRLICRLRGHQMRHVDVTEGVFSYCQRCLRTSWSPRAVRVTSMRGQRYWIGEDE